MKLPRLGLLVAGLLTAAVITPAPAAAATTETPVGDLGTAVTNFLTSPDRVAGANDWSCRPSAAHPEPVVLVHATFVNQGANWVALAPTLANAGYCVYAFNYGMNPVLSAGRVGGLTDIAGSARVMRAFVDRVLRATGAAKVDVVGHSQGGLMPHYYLERLGGAPKVRTFVALAPSNHGTDLNGLIGAARSLNLLGFANRALTSFNLAGLVQQETGSAFQRGLFADGDTVPGPRYAVITSNRDTVVTPYTNAFLTGPNVTNVLLQDQCPDDRVGHVGLFLDSPAIQNVVNQLGDGAPDFRPVCRGYGPAV
ncbi:esterase/lipase family protein [Cryptosporangium arvum]|uniref:Lipase (Class 2) n=1 Tax=Cryptosporangium arvum DSM 44712 TaxID=927661 RepID=A0A010ZZH6_9ACTN|nr:alpha/beta fold hydrolase [Cryptosporangium arvum]EXG82627.1 Lipase (class 2) [Cryptosporangium arvum DSM 44712]